MGPSWWWLCGQEAGGRRGALGRGEQRVSTGALESELWLGRNGREMEKRRMGKS